MSPHTYKPLGDTGIRIQLGNKIHPQVNRRIRSFCWYLEKFPIQGIIEWIPTYTTVTIYYKPHVIRYKELIARLDLVTEEIKEVEMPPAEMITIPTLYGGEYGPDLAYVAEYNELTSDEVIQIHSNASYLIYMMGFVPGFPYLGGMSRRINAPRLENPRSAIPQGSIGIAGSQTGIYPIVSPGGWRLIGKTPIPLYDPTMENPILLKAGNYITFKPIDEEEFHQISEHVHQGKYEVEKHTYKGED